MNVQSGNERSRLWILVLLMCVPSLFWLLVSWIQGATHTAIFQGMRWMTGSSILFSAIILILPFLWKGSLNGGTVLRGLFRSIDLLSILLVLMPLAIWIVALYARSENSITAFHLQLPLKGLLYSPYWGDIVVSSISSLLAVTFGMLVICSATNQKTRFQFLAILGVFGVFGALATYGIALSNGWARQVPASVYSPIPTLVEQVGSVIVIVALLQRERNSIQAIAAFLVMKWVLSMMPYSHDVFSMAIGLFGGAGLIFLVNYLQRTGRWVRWSAENAIEPQSTES